MPLMGLREYARYRRAKGLPGGSAAAVTKAISSGRINRTSDGRIDSELADRSWKLNTREVCRPGDKVTKGFPGCAR